MCWRIGPRTGPQWVNDVHAQLNATRVRGVRRVHSVNAARDAVAEANRSDIPLCIAGARHAMGGQAFATDALLLDTRPMDRVLAFDPARGVVEAGAGVVWPDLVRWLLKAQRGAGRVWSIAQKQTGADALCLGGAVSANIHGRGLTMRPLVSDLDAFTMVDAAGDVLRCSREENAELFRLAAGGYGLFGVITSVAPRLRPRIKLMRVVEVRDVDGLTAAFEERIRDGFLYGDFQYAIDERSPDFMRRGVFSCYRPVPMDTPVPARQREVSRRQWHALVHLAHTEKTRAFHLYADYYLSTSGQVYWSDTHQLGAYLADYHKTLDRRMRADHPATEVITELSVPRERLADLMAEAREDFRRHGVNVIYGTIRLIERDDESFLAWARQPYACVIFNLHTVHTEDGIAHSAAAFRRLNDMAIRRGGTFYLTYHRFATRAQVAACYPQFEEFLQRKRRYDPRERFQSDWYRSYRNLFDREEKG